jgi:glycosyltransferase involved in cell wall biosynthesis
MDQVVIEKVELHTHTFIFGSNTFGGHEMMAAKIISEVNKSFGSVRVIAPRNCIEMLKERLPPNIEFIEHMYRARRFELLLGSLNPRLGKLRESLRKVILGSNSVTIVSGGLTADHALALAAAQLAKLEKIMIRMYYPMLHSPNEMGLKRARGITYLAAQRRIAKAYDCFVTIDDIWRQRLIDIAGRSLDVHLIHNFLEVKSNPRVSPIKSSSPVRICFVGRLERNQKGLDLLIDTLRQLRAMRDLPAMHWIFIGSGPDERMLRENCKILSAERLTFEFLGWQKNATAWMDECHALVLPSRLEGVPTVVAEAIALGLTVFAYRIAGANLLLPREVLVEPFDTESMAESIARFAIRVTMAPLAAVDSPYLEMLQNQSRFRAEVTAVYDTQAGTI